MLLYCIYCALLVIYDVFNALHSDLLVHLDKCYITNVFQQFDRSRKKFVQALVDNMESRFPNEEMMMAATVLDPSTWPTNDDEKVLYGDREVVTLAKATGMPVNLMLIY